MAQFIGTDGEYVICGDNVKTVVFDTLANGQRVIIGEYMASYADFLIWHRRSAEVVDEMARRRAAKAHLVDLKRERRKA